MHLNSDLDSANSQSEHQQLQGQSHEESSFNNSMMKQLISTSISLKLSNAHMGIFSQTFLDSNFNQFEVYFSQSGYYVGNISDLSIYMRTILKGFKQNRDEIQLAKHVFKVMSFSCLLQAKQKSKQKQINLYLSQLIQKKLQKQRKKHFHQLLIDSMYMKKTIKQTFPFSIRKNYQELQDMVKNFQFKNQKILQIFFSQYINFVSAIIKQQATSSQIPFLNQEREYEKGMVVLLLIKLYLIQKSWSMALMRYPDIDDTLFNLLKEKKGSLKVLRFLQDAPILNLRQQRLKMMKSCI